MKKLVNPFVEIEESDTIVLKPSEIIEEQFINEYFILVRRVKGMGLTLNEFWDMDLKTFGQLFSNEMEIIKQEEKEAEKQRLNSKSTSKTGKMTTPKFEDDERATDILGELTVN